MSLATVFSRARLGLQAPAVTVEVHLSNGLPSLSIVGMPETAVKESRDRVRSAIINSHFDFPARRITINLAPADLPKGGGQFDLPIALGILAASQQIPAEPLAKFEFVGELGLNGELRAVPGCLPAAIACGKQSRQFFCPTENMPQVSLADDVESFCASSLLQTCAHLSGQASLLPSVTTAYNPVDIVAEHSLDLCDVKGQHQAKRALEIAAAGQHHLLLYGPPGTGKSMLASRLPGIMPPLDKPSAIEVACVQSLTQSDAGGGYPSRPFAAPHHTASAASLVGGGSNPKPGEISLAHKGVLFLDELPEFQRQVLEVLREPLECGSIRISRAAAQVEYPARFQLVAAMNPCPCGFFGDSTGSNRQKCRCSPDQVQRYRHRLSGPLLDRIDLHVPVLALKKGELYGGDNGENSHTVQARVMSAYQYQLDRQGCSNAALSAAQLEQICPLNPSQQQLMENTMLTMGYSARVLHKAIKVARTIADLAQENQLLDSHLMEAFSYRSMDKSV
ncbi:MAG: YifB family Mg chelatase-like AAA ATPase [Cellvibrionaceae bacterium]